MLWNLQEDNDPKHPSKLVVKWKKNNADDEIHCLLTSTDLAPVENIRQLFKMNLRRKINLWFRQQSRNGNPYHRN